MKEAAAKEALQRLRRIEGQIRGLQAMIEQGRSCQEIATQASAALVALRRVAALIVACSIAEAVVDAAQAGEDPSEAVRDLVKTFSKMG